MIESEVRFLIENTNGLREQSVGFSPVVADSGQTHATMRSKRAHHVKHDAGLLRLIEMNAVTGDDVKQVVRREDSIQRRVLMVAGHETFLLAKGSGEHALVRVVGAIR